VFVAPGYEPDPEPEPVKRGDVPESAICYTLKNPDNRAINFNGSPADRGKIDGFNIAGMMTNGR